MQIRADNIGSLLRPPELLEAREASREGKIGPKRPLRSCSGQTWRDRHEFPLLILYAEFKAAKCLTHAARQNFMFIGHNFGLLVQNRIYRFLQRFPLRSNKPVVPIFETFPGADHKVDRRIFDGAQGLSGNIASGVERLGAEVPELLTQLFFFTGSNFSINKNLDCHDSHITITPRSIQNLSARA